MDKFEAIINKIIFELLHHIVPFVRRVQRFCFMPYLFYKIDWKECGKDKLDVILDFIYIFFVLKDYPDNYMPCRLFEKKRSEWEYFYGSGYNPFQRKKLSKEIWRREYWIVFDDKFITEQICLANQIPIKRTIALYDPIDNIQQKMQKDTIGLDSNSFIFKPKTGSAGKGIYKILREDDLFICIRKGKKISVEELKINSTYMLQNCIQQNFEMAIFNTTSLNTIRVVTFLNSLNEIFIVGTYIRFGRKGSVTDNVSDGGISAGVHTNSGKLMDIGWDRNGKTYLEHPDSKIQFKGYTIPYWNKVIQLSHQTQAAFPYYKMLGIDVAIERDSPVIVEINSQPDLVALEQRTGALLRNPTTLMLFKNHNLLFNRRQRLM